MHDVIIIGNGAAGLSAGLYAGRYTMKTLVIGQDFGGLTASAGSIENYPGYMKIDGYDLMVAMRDQVKSVGGEMIDGWVTKIEHDGSCFSVYVDDERVHHSKSVIFAGGAKHRELGLANEKSLTGKGIHYCMTCDGPVYTGKTVAVVGGGDSAVKGVNLSAEYVEKIYMIVREAELTAEPINLDQLRALGDKVEILRNTVITEIVGDRKLDRLTLSVPHNGSTDLVVDGLFVEIGSVPNVELAVGLGAELDSKGYIQTDTMMKTTVPGFFAAGDTVNLFGAFKQDITAAAMGAVAATSAYEFTKTNPGICETHLQIA